MTDALARAGLCRTCRHARTITSGRGSTFLLCERSRTDPHFPRYPPLPVLRCAGHEPVVTDATGTLVEPPDDGG
jgi:hypothetical protein